jgi:hypothetical protein
MAIQSQFQAAETGVPENVLDGLALAAAPDEFARLLDFGWGQLPFEVEIKLEALELEKLGQQ